jgi:hypothetical protein
MAVPVDGKEEHGWLIITTKLYSNENIVYIFVPVYFYAFLHPTTENG